MSRVHNAFKDGKLHSLAIVFAGLRHPMQTFGASRVRCGLSTLTIIMVKMTPTRPYALIYAPEVKGHVRAIEAKHYSFIHKTIENQLLFEPTVETKNRKPLKRSAAFEGEWELRLGPDHRFRVSYEVDHERREVHILAIGVKRGNRVIIGGEEVLL